MCNEYEASDYEKRTSSIAYANTYCATHQTEDLIAKAQEIYNFITDAKPVVHRRKRKYTKRVKVTQ